MKDYVSRELLEGILEGEEEHIDWLETQIGLAGSLGLQNWRNPRPAVPHSGAQTLSSS